MINRIYRLKEPGRIEFDFGSISLADSAVIVRPKYLAICAADQRYYRGERSPEAMKKKLPMALIHEGMGTVLWDPTKTFAPGETVVMIPNVTGDSVDYIKENYRRESHFLSSGYDGFMQDYVALAPEQLIRLPENAGIHYVLTELLSVACNAISTWKELGRTQGDRFGVWGSGSVGYITALALRILYPSAHITMVGRSREKLNYCSFADRLLQTSEVIPENEFDCCFECVGGSSSQLAIDQMISAVRPQGTIVLLGVNEEPVPMRTRMILEKGLAVLGASRSSREDFEMAVGMIQRKKRMENYLKVIISQIVITKNLKDIDEAFNIDNYMPFKTVMEWKM